MEQWEWPLFASLQQQLWQRLLKTNEAVHVAQKKVLEQTFHAQYPVKTSRSIHTESGQPIYTYKGEAVSEGFFENWRRTLREMGNALPFRTSDVMLAYTRWLLDITKKLNRTMDHQIIIQEVARALDDIHGPVAYTIWLSHDHKQVQGVSTEELQPEQIASPAVQTFLTGELRYEQGGVYRHIYLPFRGNQGIYGVLQVVFHETTIVEPYEHLLCDFGEGIGVALENAQLYQNTKQQVRDLQIVNDTSKTLNTNLRITEVATLLKTKMIDAFHASEVGFLIQDDTGKDVQIVEGSTSFFENEKVASYLLYAQKSLQKNPEPLFIGDFSQKVDFPTPYRSMLVMPFTEKKEWQGFSMVLHKEPYFFSFETFKLLQSLVGHSSLAFTNSKLREELERLVVTDHLTRLFSRHYLDEQIQQSLEKDKEGSFLLVDLDNFKTINDTHGHQVGDRVLLQVADCIREHIRMSDTGARWGGEELAVYLPNAPIDVGVSVAERLLQVVEKQTNPPVTISCGVSHWEREVPVTAEKLFHMADKAMYRAKSSGKNQLYVQE